MDTRLIAIYLPQFHPIPENDAWWGRGFTEWTNVTRATPRFRGHYQPHLPTELGFYDLRVPEVRQAQADLAREYGIGGFCYYHYWFGGRRLLERPFDEVLASGRPDFPFMLAWANENWTRRWDGAEEQVLMRQDYGEEDDRKHFAWLERAWRDPRYIRFEGRPVFMIYRANALPHVKATLDLWRRLARESGLGELYFIRMESHPQEKGRCVEGGFDAAVEIAPDWGVVGSPLRRSMGWRVARKLGLCPRSYGTDSIFRYEQVRDQALAKGDPGYRLFRSVFPMWDNSARRRQAASIIIGSSPDLYREWLKSAIRLSQPLGDGSRVVFINAWNEWAEGNHLEPCQRHGRAYLEATRAALAGSGRPA